ncbi:hypothetical protein Ptr86124_000083 [Pyrenophora tritici-repentis]|uniref:Uncharacterized protein n=1 Tax=Pyrenophora tritici-repentis TaxID=45151 RepID=A0A922T2U4_9PLEO|nr:hypothetical protein Ptr86124_000083 [Pyrenophora tritici-repentis]
MLAVALLVLLADRGMVDVDYYTTVDRRRPWSTNPGPAATIRPGNPPSGPASRDSGSGVMESAADKAPLADLSIQLRAISVLLFSLRLTSRREQGDPALSNAQVPESNSPFLSALRAFSIQTRPNQRPFRFHSKQAGTLSIFTPRHKPRAPVAVSETAV